MRQTPFKHWPAIELFVPLSVFLILVWYVYGILFVAPYPGFSFHTGTGRIVEIDSQSGQIPTLQIGDILVQVGPISWGDYKRDARLVLFEGVRAGEIVEITVNRNGTEMLIPWTFAGFDKAVFKTRLFNMWWLAFVFWIFGSAGQLLIRPRDVRRTLVIAANYLTALWLIFGSLSSRHIWGSSLLLHAVTWLILPVYLHLHWVFPRPIKELPKMVWISAYSMGFILAAAEITQSLPKSLYAFAFLIALVGSFVLEINHYIHQPEQRQEMTILAGSLLVAFVPSIILGFLVIAGHVPYAGPAALFVLPFMPLMYFYVISRRQLGGLEVRLNRIISRYSFLILVSTALFLLVIPITSLDITFETSIFIGVLVMIAAIFLAIITFPEYQAFVERRFLGIKLPHQYLPETYSNRIAASSSTASLLQILKDEVFPSLLVRQYAFLQNNNGNLKPLLVENISADTLPLEDGISRLVERSGKYIPNFSSADEWIRLILPLKAGDSFIGFWLLGRRDPDDIYPQAEIPIMQSIANQTAIALSNIVHSEQLRMMYQSDIERNERERMRLALELHDSVLNELAALRANLGGKGLSQKLSDSYEDVVSRLREIVSNLRPPMLMYGLVPAIRGLADNLMERNGDKIKIVADIEAGEDGRLPENIEQHIFRIVQEACHNAVRHAAAKNIFISGAQTSRSVELVIEDDGVGFDEPVDMDKLRLGHHFGLDGMLERAKLIGAETQIRSAKSSGTKICIKWHNPAENT